MSYADHCESVTSTTYIPQCLGQFSHVSVELVPADAQSFDPGQIVGDVGLERSEPADQLPSVQLFLLVTVKLIVGQVNLVRQGLLFHRRL